MEICTKNPRWKLFVEQINNKWMESEKKRKTLRKTINNKSQKCIENLLTRDREL